jgi:hypothetical protein
MNIEDIRELFALHNVLAQACGSVDADIVTEPEVLAALLDWKRSGQVEVNLSINPNEPSSATARAKGKRGKTTESPDSDSEPPFEATPDPASDEPDF